MILLILVQKETLRIAIVILKKEKKKKEIKKWLKKIVITDLKKKSDVSYILKVYK